MMGFHYTHPVSGNIWQLIAFPSERVDALLVGNTADRFPPAVNYTEKLVFRFVDGTYRALASGASHRETLHEGLCVEGRLRLCDILS